TILAHFLSELHAGHFRKENINMPVYNDNNEPFTAKTVRDFNDELFDPAWKGQMSKRLAYVPGTDPESFGDYKKPAWLLRKAWLTSGRYIDVARLNEKLQKVGLKRLLGMLGLQIMESDKLDAHNNTIRTLDELADLLAYNISDVVN